MPTIQDEILNQFFARLGQSGAIDEVTIKALRALFASGTKVKADDVAAVLKSNKKETEL